MVTSASLKPGDLATGGRKSPVLFTKRRSTPTPAWTRRRSARPRPLEEDSPPGPGQSRTTWGWFWSEISGYSARQSLPTSIFTVVVNLPRSGSSLRDTRPPAPAWTGVRASSSLNFYSESCNMESNCHNTVSPRYSGYSKTFVSQQLSCWKLKKIASKSQCPTSKFMSILH